MFRRFILSFLAVLLLATSSGAAIFESPFESAFGSPFGRLTSLPIHGGSPTVVFSALTPSPTYTIENILVGTGPMTVARTTTQYVLDTHTGYYVAVGANLPAYRGRHSGGVVYSDDGTGTPLADYGLWVDPPMTNSFLYSRDIPAGITAGKWTGAAQAVLNAIGLSGLSSTATTLTDSSGIAFETRLQDVTITNNSNTHVARFFVAKDTNETRFPEILFNLTGGTSQYVYLGINTKTGATANRSSAGTVAYEVNNVGNWWVVLISVANNSAGNTTARIDIRPAIGTTLGTPDAAATGSIIVGNAELYLNKTIAKVRGTGPIFTTTAAVTTGAQTGYIPAINHSVAGPAAMEIELYGTATAPPPNQPIFTINSVIVMSVTGGAVVCNDGVNTATSPALANGYNKVACVYGGSSLVAIANGVSGTPAAFDGTMGSNNNVYIFNGVTQSVGGRNWDIWTGATYDAVKTSVEAATL